jgi:streptomycin 6-kinase
VSPEAAISRWQLADLSVLAETATSCLWRATSPEFGADVLNILKPYGADEIHGVHLMQGLNGAGSARIYGVEGSDILMEALPGPMLGDLVR